MTRPTVWVIKEQIRQTAGNSAPMDYTPAYKFGDLKFITEFDLPLHNKSTVASEWYKQVLKFVQEYDPQRDFIILTGQPLAIFAVGMIMGMLECPPRFLVWRREQNQYVPFDPVDLVAKVQSTVPR